MAFWNFWTAKKPSRISREDLLFPKIDLHVHALPGVDDGAGDGETSLEMMKAALAAGVVHMNVTAHHRGNLAPSGKEIEEAFGAIRELRTDKGLPLSLSCSQETEFFPGAEEFLKARPLACTGLGRKHPLLEFTLDVNAKAAMGALFQLCLNGLTPIIVHPERFFFVQRDYRTALELRQRGALLMPNATSLAGHYGPEAQEVAEMLVKEDAADALASDAHRPQSYGEYLLGCQRAAEIAGLEKLESLTWRNPCRILGYEPASPEDDYDPFSCEKQTA